MKIRLKFFLPGLCLLSLLLVLSAAAQTGSYGAISGRVICEEGVVPFASVTITSVNGRERGNAPRTVITDAEGRFKVDGLRATALQMIASAPGYVLESAATNLEPDTDSPTESALPNYYRIGDEVTIRLVKGGVITGRVLNPAGDPVIGMRVLAQPVNTTTALLNFAEAQSDDRGIYRLFGLAAGKYVVVANAGMPATPGGGRGGQQQRNPLAGDAPVYYPGGNRAAAVEIAVQSGAENSGIDIQYRSVRGFGISGTVSGTSNEDGRGGAFTIVTLMHKASGQIVSTALLFARNGGGRRGAATDNSGETFSLTGVADGEYEITAQRNGGGEIEATAPWRVLVSGADVAGITLMLKPMAAIRAQVKFETISKCDAPRALIPEEQLFALRAETISVSATAPVRAPAPFSAPDRAGELNFRGLAAGRYRLLAQLLDERLYIRSITAPVAPVTAAAKAASAKTATFADAGRNGLTLKSGERMNDVIVMAAEGAASFSGKVLNARTTVPMRIHLIPAEREHADNVLRYAETPLSNDGAFRFRNLAPGKYWMLVQAATANTTTQPAAFDSAARLRLRRTAEAANQLIELQPCQRLNGYELSIR